MLGKYGYEELLAINPGEPHHTEAQFCIKNQKSLIDFDCWVYVEECLGFQVSYDIYAKIDDLAEYVLLEYYSDEIKELYQKIA